MTDVPKSCTNARDLVLSIGQALSRELGDDRRYLEEERYGRPINRNSMAWRLLLRSDEQLAGFIRGHQI